MKKYTIIFFAFILTFVFCDDEDSSEVQYCLPGVSASKAKDCENIKLPSDEYYKCCYFKGKMDNENTNTCVPLKKSEYDDIKKTIENSEKNGGKVDKLDCNSSYLKYSLISLLLILL